MNYMQTSCLKFVKNPQSGLRYAQSWIKDTTQDQIKQSCRDNGVAPHLAQPKARMGAARPRP